MTRAGFGSHHKRRASDPLGVRGSRGRATSHRTRLVAASLVVTMLALAASTAPAAAAPVYEMTGEWISPPATIATGNPVVADWRFNINDDQPAPSNDPVDNVTAVLTAGNGTFDGIPDICLTDGVTPPSSISVDGTVLTCNFGTVNMGTAMAVQTPIIAAGDTGEEVTLGGSYMGETEALPPIPIVNPFGMDIRWGVGTPTYSAGAGYFDVDYQWTLSKSAGSEAGPQTVTYDLTIASPQGAAIQIAPEVCTPFTSGAATGHPWSGGSHPANQMTSAVGSCTFTQTGPNTFQLTLSGIDYEPAAPPTIDSAGTTLPTDEVALASGTIWVRVLTSAEGSATVTSNAPTYTSVSGQTDQDDPANNAETKAWTTPGIYSSGWGRGYTNSGGTTWDDTYQVAAGTFVGQYMDTGYHLHEARADDLPVGMCAALDTRYVEFEGYHWGRPGYAPTGAVVEYYTGGDPTLDPASASYDPNAFYCGGAGGWSTTPPADLTTVRAFRTTMTQGQAEVYAAEGITPVLSLQIKPDTPAGTDVWSFFSGIVDLQGGSDWWNGTGCITNTPGLRYPCTTGFRDLVRIITASPAISKSAADPVVTPGVPASFTIGYAANGTGAIPPTVDGFVIVDTLPANTTYVLGSATPEPAITTNGSGQQVLTWTLDGVQTNTNHQLTYEAVVDSSATPGEVLTNSATASVGGVTTNPATASVTVSTNGYTQIAKTADQEYIPNPTGDGVGTGSWTVTLRSFDPQPQAFTDTIDILPYNGDQRGTSFSGDYALTGVDAPAGSTVYYTTADPTTLSDDPADASNGAAGTVAGNTVGWTTVMPADATAFRVIGPELDPGATFAFGVDIATDGIQGGDVLVNRAQARSEHTELVTRTSALTVVANWYAATLKKYVQDKDGVWHDANDAAEYPSFEVGDTVSYRIVLTNIGQGTLTNIDITDDQFPAGSFHVDTLAPDEEEIHEFEVTLDDSHLGELVNTASATVLDTPPDVEEPPEIEDDPAGARVSDTDFDKVMVDVVDNGDGTSTVTYDLVVTRAGVDGIYRLSDELHYGEGTTVLDTEVVNTDPGTITTNAAWDGADDPVVVESELIAAGASHTYRATVLVEVDPTETTPASSDCDLSGGESGTGFLNQATLEVDQETFEGEACEDFPAVTHTKDLTSGPTPLGGGQYEVGYTLTVTNNGTGEGTYDLDDTLEYGEAVTVIETSPITAEPDTITPNAAWDGLADVVVVDDEPIAGAVPDAPEVHTYTLTVVVSVDGGTLTFDNSDCTMGAGETGTGLHNTSTLTFNGTEEEDDACAALPKVTHTKDLTSGPTSLGDNRYELGYTITVTNEGAGAGTYDLDDELLYGAGITVEGAQVVNDHPGDIDTHPGWNGLDQLVVVEGQDIDPGTASQPATHTYEVTVIAVADAGALAPAAADCLLAGGEAGTGFHNESTMTSNGIEETDDACAEVPPASTDDSSGAAGGGADNNSGSGDDGDETLARTGVNVGPLALAGLFLAFSGSAVMLDRRRRLRRPVSH